MELHTSEFSPVQINYSVRKNGQNEVTEKSTLVNIRANTVAEGYQLYAELKQKMNGELTVPVEEEPFIGNEYADDKICPHCKIDLVLRTAKTGKNSGNDFWGCPNFKRGCRFTMPA